MANVFGRIDKLAYFKDKFKMNCRIVSLPSNINRIDLFFEKNEEETPSTCVSHKNKPITSGKTNSYESERQCLVKEIPDSKHEYYTKTTVMDGNPADAASDRLF